MPITKTERITDPDGTVYDVTLEETARAEVTGETIVRDILSNYLSEVEIDSVIVDLQDNSII